MSTYLQLEFLAAGKDLDRLETALFTLGAQAVSIKDAQDQPIFEYHPDQLSLWESLIIQALFNADTNLDSLQSALSQTMGPPGPASWQLRALPDQDWHRVWMDNYQPLCFGQRLWVCPSWKPVPADCSHPIILDPGTAFGTGTHATTALCLEWLDGAALDGKTVVDFGSGSGILAIAAAVLGAQRVLAIDNDPAAVAHSEENCARNQPQATRVQNCHSDDYPELAGEADLVMANILAEPLCQLKDELCELLAEGGQILLSGILESQVERVIAAYNDTIRFAEPRLRDDWVLLLGQRRIAKNAKSIRRS